MRTPTPPTGFVEACRRCGAEPGPDVLQQWGAFLGLLLEANRRTNLTAIRDSEEAWRRHILETVALAARLESGPAAVADIGSGGGVPGIPLAILRPDLDLVLIESRSRKAAFLAEACRALGLARVAVLAERAEAAGRLPDRRERADAVVARAVAPLPVLLELALPLLKTGGRLLAVKGERAQEEVGAAGRALELLGGSVEAIDALLPGTDNRSRLVIVKKTAATPDRYPRAPGTPARRPL